MGGPTASRRARQLLLHGLRRLVTVGVIRGRIALSVPASWPGDLLDLIRDSFLAASQGQYTLSRSWVPSALEALGDATLLPQLGARALLSPMPPLKKLFNEACAELRPPLVLTLSDFRDLVNGRVCS